MKCLKMVRDPRIPDRFSIIPSFTRHFLYYYYSSYFTISRSAISRAQRSHEKRCIFL
jgi:hypothetical protein